MPARHNPLYRAKQIICTELRLYRPNVPLGRIMKVIAMGLASLAPSLPEAFLILTMALSAPFATAYGDTLFYKCNAATGKIDFKALYWLSQYSKEQQANLRHSVESRGYKNVGKHLLTYNSHGYLVSSETQTMDCRIRDKDFVISIGTQPGNVNAMGSCGAWSTHWIAISERGKQILPMTTLSSCQGNRVIYRITINTTTTPPKIKILKTDINDFRAKVFRSSAKIIRPHNIDLGITTSSIAVGANSIWIAQDESETITQLSRAGAVIGAYHIDGHPLALAVGPHGDIISLVGRKSLESIITLNRSGQEISSVAAPQNPTAIFVTKNNEIWTNAEYNLDAHSPRRSLFRVGAQGNITKVFTSNYPIDNFSISHAGNIWILGDHTLLKLSSNSQVLVRRRFDNYPELIAVGGPDNDVWVGLDSAYPTWNAHSATYGPGIIKELDRHGNVIKVRYTKSDPTGLAVDDAGNVWVGNGKILTEIPKEYWEQHNRTPNE